VLSYPSGMTVSNRALIMLADLLRAHCAQLRTRVQQLGSQVVRAGDGGCRDAALGQPGAKSLLPRPVLRIPEQRGLWGARSPAWVADQR
jgi:hypothetical protein